MGSCVSVHKDPTSGIDLRFSVGSTKNQEILIPSLMKEKPLSNGDSLVVSDVVGRAKTQTSFRSYGSKEDLFFDSQPWLESDCEDDFYSVNGDFTPSRGNTPVHHSFFSALQHKTTVHEKNHVSLPEPSPKKRLSELFEESLREHQDSGDQDGADKNNDKSLTGTPYVSGSLSVYSAERTSNGGRTPDDTSVRYSQCCMPKLLSGRSYSGRKKKLVPGHNVDFSDAAAIDQIKRSCNENDRLKINDFPAQ